MRRSRKYGEKKLELAGLVTPRKSGGFYDRFRNRLMIPIHRETGALVGFGGRSLDGSEPKYLNSPDSELFNKSRLLYNLHRSKDAMRRIDRFLELLGNATAIFDFALKEWAGDVSQLTGREKSERIEGFVPLLGAVTDPVVRNDAAQRIADAFRLEFETVWSRVRGKSSAPR